MPLTKIFFLCTSFALQIKQTPILAGAIILDTMKKPTHMLGCLEASRKSLEKNTPVPIDNSTEGRRSIDGLVGLSTGSNYTLPAFFLSEASYHLGHTVVEAFVNGLKLDEGFSIINFHGLLIGVPILQTV